MKWSELKPKTKVIVKTVSGETKEGTVAARGKSLKGKIVTMYLVTIDFGNNIIETYDRADEDFTCIQKQN